LTPIFFFFGINILTIGQEAARFTVITNKAIQNIQRVQHLGYVFIKL